MTGVARRQTEATARAGGELQYHHLAIAFLSVIAIFMLIEPLYKAFLPIYLSYNEGFNAQHALRAMRGQNLYVISNPLIINNYPPLSFYVVGGLGSLLGDNVFAGRFVSIASFFVTALNVSVIVFKMCRNRPAAIFAGIYFAASMASVYEWYIGTNNPQLFGHALMTTGLAVLVGSEEKRRNLLLSAVFIASGGFVKHNMVAMPAAVAIYLLVHHRKSFYIWFSCLIGSVAAAFAMIVALSGFEFISNLNSPREFTAVKAFRKMLSEPLRFQVPIAFWFVYSSLTYAEKYTLLLGAYVVVAAVAAVGFSGGAGVAINVFFDLVIALSLAVGLGLHRANEVFAYFSAGPVARLVAMTALSLALCLGIVIHVPIKVNSLVTTLPELAAIQTDTATDIEYLKASPGPVYCESTSLCYWAGKEFEVDPFNSRQAFVTGTQDEEMLLTKVRSGYFDVIQLANWDSDREDERMSNRFIRTIEDCYRIDRLSVNGAFFAPLPAGCEIVKPAGDPARSVSESVLRSRVGAVMTSVGGRAAGNGTRVNRAASPGARVESGANTADA